MTTHHASPTDILDVDGRSVAWATEHGAEWLEHRGGYARYWIGGEESAWACRECDTFGGDPDREEGCPHCGYGDELWADDDDDDDLDEAA